VDSQPRSSRLPGRRGTVEGVHTPTSRPELYDPATSARLVRAHRAAGGGAATCVVSDVLWGDVLSLLRWADATLVGPPQLRSGTAWRTAAAAAGLLRRLPVLCDELGESWPHQVPRPTVEGPARPRLQRSTDLLAARFRAPGDRTPLCVLAVDVDDLGAAAVALLAEDADWAGLS
jgi:hypothetical protein